MPVPVRGPPRGARDWSPAPPVRGPAFRRQGVDWGGPAPRRGRAGPAPFRRGGYHGAGPGFFEPEPELEPPPDPGDMIVRDEVR